MKKWLSLFSVWLPWGLRRRVLAACLGYELDPDSRIGWSWIYPEQLVMGPGARIGHLTVCKNIRRLYLGRGALLGNLNWITGYPDGGGPHFAGEKERAPELILEEEASVTHRHLLDCTDRISIGARSIVAGFRSQLLTHSVDLERALQASAPISIGAHCFVGTNCVVLGGTSLPDAAVLGAKSLLQEAQTESHALYGGVPARLIKKLPPDLAYFRRLRGFIE